MATISLLNHVNQVIKKFSRNNQAIKDNFSSAVSLNFWAHTCCVEASHIDASTLCV